MFFLFSCSIVLTIADCVSVTVIKHGHQKQDGVGEESVWLVFLHLSVPSREERAIAESKNLKAGTEVETTEEHCSVACSL